MILTKIDQTFDHSEDHSNFVMYGLNIVFQVRNQSNEYYHNSLRTDSKELKKLVHDVIAAHYVAYFEILNEIGIDDSSIHQESDVKKL